MRRVIAALAIASTLGACATPQAATTASTTAAPTITATTAPSPTQIAIASPTSTVAVATSAPTPSPTAALVATSNAPTPTPVVVATAPAPTSAATIAPTPAPTIAPTPAPVVTPSGQRPTVYLVHSADNYIHVQFDRAMAQSGTGAANVLSHYQMDGLPLPAGSTIICGSPTCDVVRIDMPQFLARGSAHLMRVAGVVGANGAPLNPDPTIASFRTDTQSETP